MRVDIVTKALRAIEDATGRLTPEIVVNVAHDPEHPLHDRFEWDDSIAGPKYRESQARRLIKSVMIEVKTETVRISSVAYLRDPARPTNQQGYRSIRYLAVEPDEAHQALAEEFARVAAHMRRVRDAATVLGLGDSVSAVVDQLDILRERVLDAPSAAAVQ